MADICITMGNIYYIKTGKLRKIGKSLFPFSAHKHMDMGITSGVAVVVILFAKNILFIGDPTQRIKGSEFEYIPIHFFSLFLKFVTAAWRYERTIWDGRMDGGRYWGGQL